MGTKKKRHQGGLGKVKLEALKLRRINSTLRSMCVTAKRKGRRKAKGKTRKETRKEEGHLGRKPLEGDTLKLSYLG